MKDAVKFFYELRKSNLTKKPATAELLGWLLMLSQVASRGELSLSKELVKKTLSALVKNKDDQKKSKILLQDFNFS
ncbi:MAG: hypothetical protein B6244_01135 [Candidatus Cloacimonetes bacterium 4572_55]|nr:MAG: hypothetical protein B6244_01135 [Candidatus Cloacimonetes bacterium 4572_55]